MRERERGRGGEDNKEQKGKQVCNDFNHETKYAPLSGHLKRHHWVTAKSKL